MVSLFPEKIIRDLGLKLELRRRSVASFTPYTKDGRHDGLLLSNVSEEVSRASVRALTGSELEFEQRQRFYRLSRVFAEEIWESMLEPLRSREEFQRRLNGNPVGQEAWRSLVEEPLGFAIERYLQDDLLRGLVMTDGKIGVLSHPHDPTLLQNRCFLYHLIGNKTGEWRVPVGGMGAVARALDQAARAAGAEILTRINLKTLDLDGSHKTVEFETAEGSHTVKADHLLINFGRNVLAKLLGQEHHPKPEDEGSVFKINFLLRRLPKLRAKRFAETEAFCGTFHIDEGYEQMNLSYEQARSGSLPTGIPSEVYCHTLTDDSILSPKLRARGYHTMTLFGLDTPWSLFERTNELTRAEAERRFLAGLNQWLAEPLEDCLARASDGSLCLESKTPVDLEKSLGLYHGNIFQNALTFPFAETDNHVGTWGVETEWDKVFFCGSTAQRGGAVSGIPGHNAAMKVLLR